LQEVQGDSGAEAREHYSGKRWTLAEGFPASSEGRIYVDGWQEEFILVLAHELIHIDQMWRKTPVPFQYEVEAELGELQVLREYRASLERLAA